MLDRKVKCLHCEKEFIYKTSPYRPFCSERCKMIDLGHWLNESYTVPVARVDQEEEDSLIEDAFEDGDENES